MQRSYLEGPILLRVSASVSCTAHDGKHRWKIRPSVCSGQLAALLAQTFKIQKSLLGSSRLFIFGLDVAGRKCISFSCNRANAIVVSQTTFTELFVRIRRIVVGVGFYFVFLISCFFHIDLLSLR